MKTRTFLFLVAVMIIGIIFTACAPATDVNEQPTVYKISTPEPRGEEMILVGQHDDVQVYKMVDTITEVTCYITVNSQQYKSSSIFCIK